MQDELAIELATSKAKAAANADKVDELRAKRDESQEGQADARRKIQDLKKIVQNLENDRTTRERAEALAAEKAALAKQRLEIRIKEAGDKSSALMGTLQGKVDKAQENQHELEKVADDLQYELDSSRKEYEDYKSTAERRLKRAQQNGTLTAEDVRRIAQESTTDKDCGAGIGNIDIAEVRGKSHRPDVQYGTEGCAFQDKPTQH